MVCFGGCCDCACVVCRLVAVAHFVVFVAGVGSEAEGVVARCGGCRRCCCRLVLVVAFSSILFVFLLFYRTAVLFFFQAPKSSALEFISSEC